jgi:toxin HigB-1
MIKSFRDKALKALWEKNDRSKLDKRMVRRIQEHLDALQVAVRPSDMDVDGWDYHPLSRERLGVYTVHVNGPWCITFEWEGGDAIRVNLEQYH